ncbi:MAG: FAD-dependent oxidoreductase [Deltaproteobacteria bacterium]|nr:MAG: FAD-dependent oxidoreductase [Deltaproteobacteria bacterium]
MTSAEPRPGDRVAVVGGGVSGLVAALALARRYDVALFEGRDRLGGHAHTVDVALAGATYAVDTGFVVFNDRTYPQLCRLLSALGVRSRPAPMTFGVRSDRTGVEFAVTTAGSLFAQRRNLLRPGYYRFLAGIARFNRLARRARGPAADATPLGDWLARHRLPDRTVTDYVEPLCAAIWSCPPRRVRAFPIGFLAAFLANHGMLSWSGQPQWRTIAGGSRAYVDAIARRLGPRVRLSTPVVGLRRQPDRVLVATPAGVEAFDHAIVACHADDALRLLADADDREAAALGAFAYTANHVVLHTDPRVLPRARRAWAAWNYHVPRRRDAPVSLTYAMNRLHGYAAPRELLVTVNGGGVAAPVRLGRWTVRHPAFSVQSAAVQRRHREFIARRRTSFCGAYWGYGFHEDGVSSALRVCEAFGVSDGLVDL